MRTTDSPFGPLRSLLVLVFTTLSVAPTFGAVCTKSCNPTVEWSSEVPKCICNGLSGEAPTNNENTWSQLEDQWQCISVEFSRCMQHSAKSWPALLPLGFPPCLMRTLTSNSAIAFTVAIFFALLARQSFLGYRSKARWALVVAATSLLALAFPEDERASSALDGDILPFLVLIVLSLFFGGLMVYWARFLLALLPVVVVALAPFVFAISKEFDELVGLSIGVVGGAWLYWWRDWRDSGGTTVPAREDTDDSKDKPSAIVGSA